MRGKRLLPARVVLASASVLLAPGALRADAVGECRAMIASACVMPSATSQQLQRVCDSLRALDQALATLERSGQHQQAEWMRAQIENSMRIVRDAVRRACSSRP